MAHASQRIASLLVGAAWWFGLGSVTPAWSELNVSDLAELSLEQLMQIEVVSGASKHEQKVTEAPSSVTIISAAEIQKYGYRTLADILRAVSGFFVSYDRNYSYVGVRGFGRPGDYNTRILVLVDGHRVNEGIYGSAYYGTAALVDVDLIDRIEIIRGPSSSLYGTSAFFGVIQIITKQAEDCLGAQFATAPASFGTRTGRMSIGHHFGVGRDLLLSGSILESDGQNLYFREFADLGLNGGISERNDEDQAHRLFGKLSLGSFTLQAARSSRTKEVPTAAFGTVFNDSRTHTVDELGYAELRYRRAGDGPTDFLARVSYDRYDYEGDYVFDYRPLYPDLTVNRDLATAECWGGELQLTSTLAARNTLTLGMEYWNNARQDQQNFNLEPLESYLDDRRQSRIWALYAQDEAALTENLTSNVGLRYDHYDAFGGTANPRMGLIYRPQEKTSLKLLYGRAFRAPSFYELYYADGDQTQKPNPDLDPETMSTLELVCERYLKDNFRLSASGYFYHLDGLIGLTTDPRDELMVFRNLEAISARGLELEIEGKARSGFESRASYAFQESKATRGSEPLTNSPRHLAKLNGIVPLVKGSLHAGAEVQYTSDRRTHTGGVAEGFWVANLTVSAPRLIPGVDASASVYNLFDNHYGDPGSEEHLQSVIEQDGRSFRLRLATRF